MHTRTQSTHTNTHKCGAIQLTKRKYTADKHCGFWVIARETENKCFSNKVIEVVTGGRDETHS